ncbi:energy transducer TonB [Pelagicoccus sp. NFK12]|uniref:Energy transducer TonB n=1 Tax=Pelagicoccus enzymogenes TaxID=2773457 RepID=A0A927F7I3_9BACT|nr:energy transducer TonB [Pelagicoccus enzymogenes]MBD5779299.1 energy transducer TonB [Pelagicoccus enzymogenes]
MKLAKTFLHACLLLAATVPSTSGNPGQPFSKYPGLDLQFKVLKLPHFPQSLEEEGYLEGQVRVALDIDYAGELRDWLVLESSHPAFTQSLERVIEDWRFTAPYLNGENKSIVTELGIQFRSEGNVVSMTSVASALNRRFNDLTGYGSRYSGLSSIKDLDTPPYPISQEPPSVPEELIEKYDGSRAVFTFYVDEAGQVRIPVLSQTDGDPDVLMLLAAQDAIAQWRFEPPTQNRKPVKIQLSQTFVFKK